MMNQKNNKFNQKPNLITGIMISTFYIASCAHNTPNLDTDNKTQNISASEVKTTKAASSISVNQIHSGKQSFSTDQIQTTDANMPQLTIEQLQNYVDRCLSNSNTPPAGIDCSELNLRMKNLLNSDDEVIDALVTLGQLGRAENLNRSLNELDNGQVGGSITSRAIAGGLTNGPASTPTTPDAPQTSPELTDFLQQNGLSVNQGIISRQPQ